MKFQYIREKQKLSQLTKEQRNKEKIKESQKGYF